MRRAAIGLVLVLALSGCGALIGSPVSESAWPEHTDRALGTALSALGTADIVLRAQRDDHLPGSYAMVTLRDAQVALDQEAASYRTTQPPSAKAEEHATVVARLAAVTVVLSQVTVEASAGGPDRDALAQVRQERGEVERLRDRLVPR